jgi:hypothetical protein
MPDEFGICRCGGTGEDGCKPAEEAPPSSEVQLAAELDAAVKSLPAPIFQQAVQAAITGPRRQSTFDQAVEAVIADPRRPPGLAQPLQRAELPTPTPMDTVFDVLRGNVTLENRRSRHDG